MNGPKFSNIDFFYVCCKINFLALVNSRFCRLHTHKRDIVYEQADFY